MKNCFMLILMTLMVFEVKAADDKLKGLDINRDKVVSKEEFLSSFKKRFKAKGKEFDAKNVEKAFIKKDANKDGVLTAEELAPASDR